MLASLESSACVSLVWSAARSRCRGAVMDGICNGRPKLLITDDVLGPSKRGCGCTLETNRHGGSSMHHPSSPRRNFRTRPSLLNNPAVILLSSFALYPQSYLDYYYTKTLTSISPITPAATADAGEQLNFNFRDKVPRLRSSTSIGCHAT